MMQAIFITVQLSKMPKISAHHAKFTKKLGKAKEKLEEKKPRGKQSVGKERKTQKAAEEAGGKQ
jgi:hypothetical protein